MSMVRAAAEMLIEWAGVPRWTARRRRGHTLVLAYHNIVPDTLAATGDRSLHLPLSDFAHQLDTLMTMCDVVPLPAVLRDAQQGARPRVAITFDDGYRGALTLGARELCARGLPATMFIAPGLLGGRTFWWDALAGAGGLAPADRQDALDVHRGDDDAVREWANRAGLPLRDVPEWQRSGTEADMRQSWSGQGLTLGAHTWRHANLTSLTEREAKEELAKPLDWLRARFPERTIPWLTYPYGLSSPGVAAITRSVGYEAAMMVVGGWIRRPPGNAYALPRLNIPRGLTLRGYRLRLAGLLGTGVASAPQ